MGGVTIIMTTSIFLGYNHTLITLGVGALCALAGVAATLSKIVPPG